MVDRSQDYQPLTIVQGAPIMSASLDSMAGCGLDHNRD